MTRKEIKLNEELNSVNIDVVSSDIKVYPENVKVPLVRLYGEFDVLNKESEAFITQKIEEMIINEKSKRKGIFGSNVISRSNICIQNYNGVTVINGQVMKGDHIAVNNEKSSVELVVPKYSDNLSLKVDSTAGNINIKDLILSSLIIKTTSGSISLEDIDILFAKLGTVSGNVRLSILESILNYKTFLKSISKNPVQDSIETIPPIMLEDKRHLEASSVSGDVKVLFKGRNK